MKTRPGYRALIFDLDGTLVDSYAALTDALNFARASTGMGVLPQEIVKSYVGEGVEILLQRAFEASEIDQSLRGLFEQRYDEICCERSTLLDEVADTLGHLSALGVRMTVCTNKPTTFSTKILQHLGIAGHFRAVVGPDLAGIRKPDARHVRRAIDPLECPPTDVLFVGDMPIDVEAARNSGLEVAVIATGSSTAVELKAAEPDFFLVRFSDLITIVQGTRAGRFVREERSIRL